MPADTMPAPFRPSLSVTSPTMRAFGGLPNEIAMRIINLLSRARDLKNLSETCKDLRRLARARLYEHIYVTETKWPLSKIFEFTRPSNPALKEVLDITFIRTGAHHDLFLNWDLLLNDIPWHQLRSIRVTGWSCQDEPSYFVDRVLANQQNLSTLDVRWPRLRGSQFFCWPVYGDSISTFSPASQLTSLTMSIGCETFPANPFSTAAFLTGVVTLKHLSAQFCVSTAFPTDTIEELEQYGFRLGLESLSLSGCTHSRDTLHVDTLHDFLDSIVDFTNLQTLTLRNISGAMHVVGWVGFSQRNNPQLRDLFIEEFSLPLRGLDRIGTLRSLERLVLTGRTNEHELQRLTDAIRRNHLQIRTLCLDISSRRRHGAPWPMSSLLIDDWSQLRHLLPHLPLLEELWISFPIIRSNSLKTAEKDMRNLLSMIQNAHRLRLICNLRPNKETQLSSRVSAQSTQERCQFYECDPWLHQIANTVFQRCHTELRVFAVGYLPAGKSPGKIRAFVRRQKVTASGVYSTVVEEISANDLYLEEFFHFWESFHLFEFEEDPAMPGFSSGAESMDLDDVDGLEDLVT